MVVLPNRSYRIGYNFERRVKAYLEEQGFFVKRSGKSSFPDLIAIKKSDMGGINVPDVIFGECKVGKYISQEEKHKADEIFDKTGVPLTVFWRDRRKIMQYKYKNGV